MSNTEELNDWAYAHKCQKAVENLKKNGFDAFYCHDGEEVFHYIVNEAAGAQSVGFGGSLSIADLKLSDKLKGMGKEILNHGLPGLSPEEKLAITRRQLTCDLFLTGSNAVTLSGILVNIDGNGNRAAAMFFGPQKVIVVVGRNKLVDGSIEDAVQRIRTYAAPPNAKRLNLATPCTTTGFCSDCNSPQRICRVTTIIEKKPRNTDIKVLVVNEDMGL
ncbi:lactate utilization protein [Geomonas subterranea]|uniref:Lactate utilization protein n=1 Tax=Geomonas subterranea TaxID=2847989 RepID=A0ABX8LJA3_9BACT|nr:MULTISPECIES: lactate utilization protein [Geomonas]QXE90323.1 lactate utilization protein [Geomonas subterranea]QXM07552.1 lactate utilization protein [Geomonas subterranea]